MPIDPMISDPMLGTFRNMYKECVEKEASGEAFDRMKTALDRMESLANEHSDFMAFQGQMTQENLMGNFSVAYGEVLGDLAKPKGGDDGDYDDKALLEQTLNGLREAIKSIDNGVQQQRDEIKKHAKPGEEEKTKVELSVIEKEAEKYIPLKNAIQELINFGESCENLPTFLRLQIEKGLDKATEGNVLVKGSFEEDVKLNEIWFLSPYHQERSKEIFEMYQKYEAEAPFNAPQSIDIEMERTKIEHKFQPLIEKWDKIEYEWKNILDNIAQWVASQCPRAPGVDIWVLIPEPAKSESIKFCKNCNPGIIEQQIRIFKENHGLEFKDIFTHETFRYQVVDHKIIYSQEYMIHLVNTIFPQCKTGNFISQELIDLDMKFYNEKRMYDPDPIPSIINYMNYFDAKYGEGNYVKRFGPYENETTNAASWNYEAFLPLLQF